MTSYLEVALHPEYIRRMRFSIPCGYRGSLSRIHYVRRGALLLPGIESTILSICLIDNVTNLRCQIVISVHIKINSSNSYEEKF